MDMGSLLGTILGTVLNYKTAPYVHHDRFLSKPSIDSSNTVHGHPSGHKDILIPTVEKAPVAGFRVWCFRQYSLPQRNKTLRRVDMEAPEAKG